MTAAAEEAVDGPGRWWLCSVIYFIPIFFLTITAATTKGPGDVAVSSRKTHPGRVVLVGVFNKTLAASAAALLSLLSLLPFPLLFLPLSLSLSLSPPP